MNRKVRADHVEDIKPSDMLLRRFVGYNMKRTFLSIQEDMNATLAPYGLRVGTFSALAVIVGSPGISQTQLSDVLNIKRSGVVVMIDNLEQLGSVERRAVTADRRAYALHVITVGRQLWQDAEQAVQAHEAALFSDLTPEDQRMLQDLLIRAARSVDCHRKRLAP